MIPLLFEQIQIFTPLAKEEIMDRLDSHSQPFSIWRNPIKGKQRILFEGKLDSNHFMLKRFIQYKNSFMPFLYGKVEIRSDYSYINLKIKPHEVALVLLLFFISLWVMILILFSGVLMKEISANPILLMVILSPVLVFSVLLLIFQREKKLAKQALLQLLEGKILDPTIA